MSAHEETHFLDYVRRLDVLNSAISKSRNSEVDLAQIQDREVLANIGAIHALVLRGVDLCWAESNLTAPYGQTFTKAIKSYVN